MPPNERLVKARIKSGYVKASDAVNAFGWKESAYRHHESGRRGIPASVAEKYSRAFNVSIEWLLTGRGKPEGIGKVVPMKKLPVLGRVQAGAFIEAMPIIDDVYLPIATDPDYAGYEQYLLEVAGTSMNEVYPPGSYVHCAHIEFHPDDIMPEHGDHVIVERRHGDLREVTVKEYTLSHEGAKLIPRSTDPSWQNAIILTGDTPIDEVQITALVIGCYIKRRKSPK
jgi:SOS-response transcriptional repressor LexA